ncbi:glutamine amidotransferase [Acidimicrobiaceae bacterium USS-CC1]|uniref:Glutamine amidotransferase n=1 Tax=Acidiferrimicrobium australe TaxID=2664430 RepID=A0ABW9QUJ5_9ACTN|nr:glutamine amidotransferase [Acidiferrimicrobium australe]
MCGIAGVIHRNGPSDIGREMTAMLQSMKHRGPDSTGFALYGSGAEGTVMRIKLADPRERGAIGWEEDLERRLLEVQSRLTKVGADVAEVDRTTDYAVRAVIDFDGDLKSLVDHVEDIPGCEVLSAGTSLEIVKDLGDAAEVAAQYGLGKFRGTHAIGHVRMATESDVDIAGAHPYWAYPFGDVAVVHNGQLTNYHQWRRRLERLGHRFASECDSEIIAVYLAEKLHNGVSLETAIKESLDDLDGVFTYVVVTKDSLGVAKDEMAAKPLVLYETESMVALASEEVAIRAIIDQEIETYDPYEREALVWSL